MRLALVGHAQEQIFKKFSKLDSIPQSKECPWKFHGALITLITDSVASPATFHHANDQIKQVKEKLDSNQRPIITGNLYKHWENISVVVSNE